MTQTISNNTDIISIGYDLSKVGVVARGLVRFPGMN